MKEKSESMKELFLKQIIEGHLHTNKELPSKDFINETKELYDLVLDPPINDETKSVEGWFPKQIKPGAPGTYFIWVPAFKTAIPAKYCNKGDKWYDIQGETVLNIKFTNWTLDPFLVPQFI